MKIRREEGRFVIEPQTAVENEALRMATADAPPEAPMPWECAVADALGAQLEGMACASVGRVLAELQRMNAASSMGRFDTPARPVPDLPQEARAESGT